MADERIRLELDLNQFTASAKEGTESLKTMAVVADQNLTPALKRASDESDKAADSKKKFGSTVLYASYAVQDFTSQLGTRGLVGAFAAIQNNIPQILVGLGLGTGLTGVLSVASVGLGVFADKLLAVPENAKKAAEALKDLKEKADKFREAPTTQEKQTAAKFSDYLQMIDRDKIGAGLESVLGEEAQVRERARFERVAEQEMIPGTPEFRTRMNQRRGMRISVEEATKEAVGKQQNSITEQASQLLLSLAEGKPGVVGRVQRMARARPGAFPTGLADDLASFSPEADAAADAEEAATDAFGQRASRGAAARRARRQQAEDLTRGGQVNEAATGRLEQQNAAERIAESRRLAREASRAYEQNQKNDFRQQRANDRDDAATRQQMSRLQEQIGRAQDMGMKGMTTQLETQQTIFQLQSQLSVLQERLKQIDQNNKRLQQRNTILNRGN